MTIALNACVSGLNQNMRGMHARGQAGHVVAVIASGEAWNALDGSAHEKVDTYLVDAWQGSACGVLPSESRHMPL